MCLDGSDEWGHSVALPERHQADQVEENGKVKSLQSFEKSENTRPNLQDMQDQRWQKSFLNNK